MTDDLPDRIVPDGVYPGMYRLVHADGSLSCMVNLTRAKDALAYLDSLDKRRAAKKENRA